MQSRIGKYVLLLTLGILVAGLVGCARERGPSHPRNHVHPRTLSRDGSGLSDGLVSRITPGGSACKVLDEMADEKGAQRFSLLGHADLKAGSDGQIRGTGHIELAESPFIRLILGEKFKVPTDEEFIQSAEKEHRAGRLSGASLFALKQMRWALPGKFKATKYSKVKEKLGEKFPGIFGRSGSLSDSMPAAFLNRIDASQGNLSRIARIASTSLPLFSGRSWEDFSVDAEKSLQAAITGITSDEAEERACGLVFLHRAFAQLLSVKGYHSPFLMMSESESRRSSRPASKTRAPVRGSSGFRIVPIAGAWSSSSTQVSEVLQPEVISAYDPALNLYTLSSAPLFRSGDSADLSSQIAFLEAMTLFFEATSPAAPWFSSSRYPLGDVASSDHALLPEDAHTLALGMLGMAFKNVAALGIHKVNGAGTLMKEGEAPAGIILGSIDPASGKASLRARDVSRLIQAVAWLEAALKGFSARAPEEWKEIHSSYQPKFLAKLAGRAIFSEAELTLLLDSDERESILLNTLESLHLPLALLAAKFTRDGACMAEGEWNSATGDLSVTQVCDEETRLALSQARQTLGRLTGTTVLHPAR